MDSILDEKVALPNKLLQSDGTITDMTGAEVTNMVDEYKNKPAIPNKFLNANGTYSTLNEILGSMIDTSIFIVVNELPEEGDTQKIYLLPDGEGGFIEYHWTGSTWDIIGAITNDFTIFTWDGQSSTDNPSNIQLWQDIYDKSATTSVIVALNLQSGTVDAENSFCIIGPDTFKNRNEEVSEQAIILFDWHGNTTINASTNGVSIQLDLYGAVITVDDTKNVTFVNGRDISRTSCPPVLSTNDTYAGNVNFTPSLNGHPATKKYVDDQISAKIDTISAALDAINGEVI